jgi:hypothetical protein
MKIILFLIIILLALSCTSKATFKRPNISQKIVGNALPSSAGWHENVQNWRFNWPGKPHNLKIDESMTYKGEPTLRMELRQGEVWTGSSGSQTYRMEMMPSEKFAPLDSTRFYSCNILLPRDFPIEDNRLVLMQWWPQTKSELGEVGRSPSLSLRFGDGFLTATVRHSDLHVVTDAEAVPREKIFKTNKFKLGIWHQFVFQAHWSIKDDGFVKMWWNGKQVADYKGPVGYDDEQGPIFKFGMYRDDTLKTYVAYFNDCHEGASLEEVHFAVSQKK